MTPTAATAPSRVLALRVRSLTVAPGEYSIGSASLHLIALNLGGSVVVDANLEQHGWARYLSAHHGIDIYPAFTRSTVRIRFPREYLLVTIDPTFVVSLPSGSPAIGARSRPVIGVRNLRAAHVILALAEDFRVAGERGSASTSLLAQALVAFLSQCELSSQRVPAPVLPPPKLHQVVDHISAHLDSQLPLATLAAQVDMDVSRFIRAFKHATGMSPHQYIIQLRVERAQTLLKETSFSISDIATRTGFSTMSHFGAVFRRFAHTTPRAYRFGIA